MGLEKIKSKFKKISPQESMKSFIKIKQGQEKWWV